MNKLSVFDYNGQVISRRENGFINLTQMCQANGKRLDVFMKTQKTKDYIECLENSHQTVVVYSEEGANGGTWGHPSLAINLARWISPAFAVWCDGHIFNLLSTGSTAITDYPQSSSQPQLPQRDAIAYIEAASMVETVNNLTLRELLRDELIDELSVKRGQKSLAGTGNQYTTVKVRAKELGYSTTDVKNGSALGKFVAKILEPDFIERIGKYDTRHYRVSDDLDAAIHAYFEASRRSRSS